MKLTSQTDKSHEMRNRQYCNSFHLYCSLSEQAVFLMVTDASISNLFHTEVVWHTIRNLALKTTIRQTAALVEHSAAQMPNSIKSLNGEDPLNQLRSYGDSVKNAEK